MGVPVPDPGSTVGGPGSLPLKVPFVGQSDESFLPGVSPDFLFHGAPPAPLAPYAAFLNSPPPGQGPGKMYGMGYGKAVMAKKPVRNQEQFLSWLIPLVQKNEEFL